MLELINQLEKNLDHELYVVGGYLRDLLLGIPTSDLDLVTTDENFSSVLKQLAGQNVTVIVLDEDRQIYRIIAKGDSENAVNSVDIALIQGKSIEEDLQKRDFTINAMACKWQHLSDLRQHLIDPFNGLSDLQNKSLRGVSDSSFSLDPLRIIRLLRFMVQLDFKPDANTFTKAIEASANLEMVANERIKQELTKIFQCPKPIAPYLEANQVGFQLLNYILPQLEEMRNCQQNFHHLVDVYKHCLTALEILEEWWFGGSFWDAKLEGTVRQHIESDFHLLRLTALVHDLGKPETKSVDKDGRIRFFGHDKQGSRLISEQLSRLRFSNQERNYCAKLVKNHMRPLSLAHLDKVSRKSIYRIFKEMDDLLPQLLVLSQVDMLAKERFKPEPEQSVHHLRFLEELMSTWFFNREKYLPMVLITGKDVLAHYPNLDKPLIGKVLSEINEYLVIHNVSKESEKVKVINKIVGRYGKQHKERK